jgi:hypothetical protein
VETWKPGYCDVVVQAQPTESTRIKLEPSTGSIELFRVLRGATGFSWNMCAEVVRQGLEFAVLPDQWQAFVAAMAQFDCWWYRLVDEYVSQPFANPEYVVCRLTAQPYADQRAAVAAVLTQYAEPALGPTALSIVIDLAVNRGYPFTIPHDAWADFNAKMDELPQVQWTGLMPPAMG